MVPVPVNNPDTSLYDHKLQQIFDINGKPVSEWPTELVAYWAGYYLSKSKRFGKKWYRGHGRYLERYKECYTELTARKLATP